MFIINLIPDNQKDEKLKRAEDLPKVLPWGYICIGNVKRLLLDMHHQLNPFCSYSL